MHIWFPGNLSLLSIILGGLFAMMQYQAFGDQAAAVPGPRAEQWKRVEQALADGKPKSAAEALGGIEQAATVDKAWAEVSRAIATRILTETGDRPEDDPERIVRLAAAIEKAPAETRGVLEAIRANWTWEFFQNNRWRFAGRTAGGAADDSAESPSIAEIASWDLPMIVGEIRGRFAVAIGQKDKLAKLPVADWSAIIEKGTMADAYRPTVWDVVVRDALAFAASGERGLVDPEDAFVMAADGPALGASDAFLDWKPEADPKVTDADSPLLQSARLFRELLAFHRGDADQTAFLAADLDRILWASDAAVGADLDERKRVALEAFVARAGNHETASLARFHLASLVREQGDLVAARKIAAEGEQKHPDSAGGRLCRNLVASIDARSLEVFVERTWAAPWPAIRVRYRQLPAVHLRIVKDDWQARLADGNYGRGWLDDGERQSLLAATPVKAFSIDLPATPDHQERDHDLPVPRDLAPGQYWVLASAKPDFGDDDNVVLARLVWVSRLALVGEGTNPQVGEPLSGHVVDIASGEPIAGVSLQAFVRTERGKSAAFVPGKTVTTDADGRYQMPAEQGCELVIVARAQLDGREEIVGSDRSHVWQQTPQQAQDTIVMMTDRGIHRPGQIVFFKGIVCHCDPESRDYSAVAGRAVRAVLQDANGREVARSEHVTNANGSFNGTFPIAASALPGQWTILAEAQNAAGAATAAGAAGVRVEEYKRPKFLVKLEPPQSEVRLDEAVTLTGTATTYTGLPVANAKVRWRVERETRFPIWCRWFFPWLPFDDGAARIARGTAITDPNGGFSLTFPARPDLTMPRESAPVFTYAVTVDVTDAGGETRGDERRLNAGYAPVEVGVHADAWQEVGKDGGPATVKVEIDSHSLDGHPRGASGTVTVSKLIQPDAVARGDLFGTLPRRRSRPMKAERGVGAPRPAETDPANPETWAAGEAVFSEQVTTDATTGKAVVSPRLGAGIYRAIFEIPAKGDVPAVKASHLIEVIDPTADRYPVKRPLRLTAKQLTAVPGSEFTALVGTGHDAGRAFVEISRGGRTLSSFWTAPGRTQWPVTVPVTDADRGGFTIRAWLVRDGRLQSESITVDVPWTDRRLDVVWQRFTRRVEPAAQEVWRAKITSVADPVAGEAAPVAAEMVATLYDQSLDALAEHPWPAGLASLFRREWDPRSANFSNGGGTLSHVCGQFKSRFDGAEMTYRELLRNSFGPPSGRQWRRGMERGMAMAMPMAPAAARALNMDASSLNEEAEVATNGVLRKGQAADENFNRQGGGPQPHGSSTPPPPRKNLAETAFFLPTLTSAADGSLTIEFTLPDTLTTWQFKSLAHDARLRSGTLLDSCVAAKDLMVEPMLPRFLREGDTVEIPVKLSNRSTGRLSGEVQVALSDARTGVARDELLATARSQPFDLAAGESKPAFFTLKVADGTETLRVLATGAAGRASDGEESLLPVLSKRVLVTETVPITLRGPAEKTVTLERLARPADTIESQSLVVQAAANPAWYAVLALPSIMEQSDESTETLFTRLYANSLARHLVTSDPRIAGMFQQWKGTDALESPLEKNADLMKTLLEETPWVREAVDEGEARARIALLFDATRADNEVAAAVTRLESLRNQDGGWPWFPGGSSCDPVTLGIIAGFGRLRASGVGIDMQPAIAAIPWLDRRLIEEKKRTEKILEPVLTPIGAYALYARSFFKADSPPQGDVAAAIAWGLDVARKRWNKIGERRSQGHAAIALFRSGDRETAASIIDSLRQRSTGLDGSEENWQGMWWRDPHPVWWSWASAPIETQSIMIEAFDEVAGDAKAVEAMKAWLLSRKRTSRWPGNRATADAVAALLGRGDDLLGSREAVTVTVGDETIQPRETEAGTGFFEERFVRREITPRLAKVTLRKPDAGIAWGGVHWQYLDDIANVPAAGREELAIEKRLFVKRFTKAGPQLEPIGGGAGEKAGSMIEPGDELVVRLVVTSDRDYEFLELVDHRPSLTEPIDLLSGWRWNDGAGWYLAIRDASTQMFFERLPRGTHVFEYSLRVAHRGSGSSGFATIRSRYAPEFSAHSQSIPVEVR